MCNNNELALVSKILLPHSQNECSQRFKHTLGIIFLYAITPSVPREVDGNKDVGLEVG